MDYQYISIDGGDGYFSRQPCDLCGSTLGGMRYDATGEIARKMHTCSPAERDGLKGLLDYYYGRLQTERVMRRLAQRSETRNV